ncbi:MAG: histidine--tRNA ligase [Bacilli bacterium]|nr:histidine--tRNA ligase [Bacilli bacterium]
MPYIAVKGTRDIIGEEADAFSEVEQVFKAVAELYGYKEFRTPVLEYTEVFDRSAGDSSDVVRKEMYTFMDKGNRSVTMRPEFTAGMARSIVEKKLYATEDLPIKCFYYGPAFRYERPQLGRYRQFVQAGVECVGVDSARYDAECIVMAMHVLGVLGFENLSVKVNTLGDAESRAKYKEALKAYFSEHIDKMCPDCHDRLELNPMRILDCKVPEDQEIVKGAPKMKDYLSEASDKRFYQTLSIINDMGIKFEIDENLVRGLDYYGEIVFEVHAKSATGADYGALVGGGHYDGMLKTFGGPDYSGVGFAFGVDRIVSLMKDNGLLGKKEGKCDIYVMPLGEEVIDEAFAIAMNLRYEGYKVEIPFTGGKIGGMFKKATRKGAKFALIIGEDELNNGVAQLKNMETQEQRAISLEDLDLEIESAFNPAPEGNGCCGGESCCCGGEGGQEGCCCSQKEEKEGK